MAIHVIVDVIVSVIDHVIVAALVSGNDTVGVFDTVDAQEGDQLRKHNALRPEPPAPIASTA
ncbi:MAG: hypothetical protein ABW321_20765 [Polyangiales bacterium]